MTEKEILELGAERAKGMGLIETTNEKFDKMSGVSYCTKLYRADDVHKLFGESQEIDFAAGWQGRMMTGGHGVQEQTTLGRALMINIRPIKKETAESKERELLREMLKLLETIPNGWFLRAKALLEGRDL